MNPKNSKVNENRVFISINPLSNIAFYNIKASGQTILLLLLSLLLAVIIYPTNQITCIAFLPNPKGEIAHADAC